MCGIAAISISKNSPIDRGRQALLVYHLADSNDNRGGKSFGYIGLKDGDIKILKRLGNSAPYADFACDFHDIVLHTRWPTGGSNTIENAHPFTFDHITLVHNGVLSNHSELNRKYNRNFEVDSMHLAAHLAEGRNFSDIQGYGVVAYIDSRVPDAIHFCKLSGGEFAVYGIGEDMEHCHGIVGSSDEKHIIHSLSMAGIDDFFELKIETGKVYFVQDGKVYATEERLALSEGHYQYYSWRDYADSKKSKQQQQDEYEQLWKRHGDPEGYESNDYLERGLSAWPDSNGSEIRKATEQILLEGCDYDQEDLGEGFSISNGLDAPLEDENAYGGDEIIVEDDDPGDSYEERNWKQFQREYAQYQREEAKLKLKAG